MQHSFMHIYKSRQGVAVIIVLLIVFVLLMGGATYLRMSSFSANMIAMESDKIKARNLAQAGLEAAIVVLKRQARTGNTAVYYPGGFESGLFTGDLGNGKYRVTKIKPLSNASSDDYSVNQEYKDIEYRDAFDFVKGKYTIYDITAEGILENNTTVKVHSYVKVISKDVIH